MNKKNWKGLRLTTILLVILLSSTIGIVSAVDNKAEERQDSQESTNVDTVTSVPAGLNTYLYNVNMNGGYAAAGVGMRSRGWGTILMKDIPAGSTIDRAYLFWSVLGSSSVTTPPSSYAKGKINGVSITGTNIGSVNFGNCWSKGGKVYGYRANVTAQVTGNKLYQLQNFASGYIWGDIEPYVDNSAGTNKYPMLQGATLVVIYKNAKYPLTRIQIKEGVDYPPFVGSSTTTFSGWTAPATPIAKTTYIASDGETWGESVKFNGIEMPVFFLDGKDRQNGNDWVQTSSIFTKGNLQDTNTQYVKVNPGSTSVSATIGNAGDCLVWLAQVFSMFNGGDKDGDALKDAWEVYGYDSDNNGVVDVNLPAMGADPFHKDIFVEVDWMAQGAGETRSHYPLQGVIQRSIDIFANAPYANNPDGKSGINLHVDLSNQVLHDFDLNPAITEFNAIKAANFQPARDDTHHYAIFAHGYDGGGSSGLAWGNNFMVTLGTWGIDDTPDAEVGTFVHELGHTLGLPHGGTDGVNYKPNYLSIMNYFFQIDGVYKNGKWGNYDYQRISPYTLNENTLNESNGIGSSAAGYGTRWFYGGFRRSSTTNKPIDWNLNGVINNNVAIDLNNDGYKNTLTSWIDWQHIIYNGGTIGGIGSGKDPEIQYKREDLPKELTYDEYLKIKNGK